jgi:thymidine phosphorylase
VIGEQVRSGDVLATLHTDTPDRFERSLAAITGAWEISADAEPSTQARRIVLDRIV